MLRQEKARAALASRMTADQLAEAQRLATQTATLPQAELKKPLLPPADELTPPSANQEATRVPANLPKRIKQEIGRWGDHPFRQLPAMQFDTGLWEWSDGSKQWVKVIYRTGPYSVTETHLEYGQGGEEDRIQLHIGVQRLSAVGRMTSGNWNRRTLGFSDVKPLRPSSSAKAIGGVRPQDLSVEYNWDLRFGSDERHFYVTYRVTDVTEASVTVNGTNYRLPAYELADVTQDRHGRWRSEKTGRYVPVLGFFVERREVLQDPGESHSGILTDVRVSEEVLSKIRAAAL